MRLWRRIARISTVSADRWPGLRWVLLSTLIIGLVPALTVLIDTGSAAAANYTWQGNGGHSGMDWTAANAWTTSGFPHALNDNATFPQVTDDLVNVSTSVSVNTMTFQNSSGNYWFAGSSSGLINIYGRINASYSQMVDYYVPVALQNNIEMTVSGGYPDEIRFHDNVSGTGGITLDGDGTGALVLLSGTETYSGNTYVNDGNIATGAADVMSPNSNYVITDNSYTTGNESYVELYGSDQVIGSLAGTTNTDFILDGAALTVGNSTSTDYEGNIDDGTGSGRVTKLGSGTLILGGDNTYTGPTNVVAGTLTVNGSMESEVNVISGAVLNGTGSLGDVNVYGTLEPADAIGTMTGSEFNFNSGSIYTDEINPSGSSDLLSASSNIAIDSGTTLQLDLDPGTYTLGQTYTIMSAPSITGEFSSIDASIPTGYSARLIYYSNHVDLELVSDDSSNQPLVIGAGGATPGDPNTGYGEPEQRVGLLTLTIVSSMSVTFGLVIYCWEKYKPLV